MIPFSKVQDAAKALKYTGDINDEPVVRKFVADAIDAGRFNWKHAGQPVTRALVLTIEDKGTKPEPVSFDTPADPPAAFDAEDVQRRIDAGIAAAIDKIGKRPASNVDPHVGNDAPTIEVRGFDELAFEERKRKNRHCFDTFEKASAWRDALLVEFAGCKPLGITHEVRTGALERLAKRKLVDKNGHFVRAYATSPQAAGGALTNTQFVADLLKNVNKWGVARKLAKVVMMTETRVTRPKHSGGDMTVSYPGENTAPTNTTQNPYSSLTLDAKTGVIVAQVSKQIVSDSGIDIAQDIMDDISRAFAKQEDRALFIGDGTSTYANIKGYAQRFADLTIGSAAGAQLGGATISAHTDANVLSMMGKLPDYAWDNAVFACHPATMSYLFNRLNSGTATGVQWGDFNRMGLGQLPSYRGIPIVTSNAINGTDTASANTIDLYFGDFYRSAMLGDRVGLEMAISEEKYFNEYAVAIRGVMRHDINVHDYGDTSTAGPVVCLYQS